MKINKKSRYIVVLALILVMLMSSAALAATPEGFDMEEFKEIVKTNFYMPYDEAVLETNDLDLIMEELSKNDSYAEVFSPEEYVEFMRDIQEQQFGVGISYVQTQGLGMEIKTVITGGPADRAGIKPGDVFVKVDGQDIADKTQDEVTLILDASEGRVINVVVLRDGKTFSVTMTMELIEFPHVTYEIIDDGIGLNKVGYISLATFNDAATNEMYKALLYMNDEKVNYIVLDMQNNLGGSINSCYSIANMFLDQQIINREVSKNGGWIYHSLPGSVISKDVKIIVLVNENSASSSEILVQALADNDRALSIGTPTAGVGHFKFSYPLSNGGGFFFIGGENRGPDRNSVIPNGYQSDFCTSDYGALDTVFEKLVTSVKDLHNVEVKLNSKTAIADGKAVELSVAPIEKDGRVYVGLRDMVNLLSLHVDYKYDEALIYAFGEMIAINANFSYVRTDDGFTSIKLLYDNGRMMVPVSMFREYLGYNVIWNELPGGATVTVNNALR